MPIRNRPGSGKHDKPEDNHKEPLKFEPPKAWTPESEKEQDRKHPSIQQVLASIGLTLPEKDTFINNLDDLVKLGKKHTPDYGKILIGVSGDPYKVDVILRIPQTIICDVSEAIMQAIKDGKLPPLPEGVNPNGITAYTLDARGMMSAALLTRCDQLFMFTHMKKAFSSDAIVYEAPITQATYNLLHVVNIHFIDHVISGICKDEEAAFSYAAENMMPNQSTKIKDLMASSTVEIKVGGGKPEEKKG